MDSQGSSRFRFTETEGSKLLILSIFAEQLGNTPNDLPFPGASHGHPPSMAFGSFDDEHKALKISFLNHSADLLARTQNSRHVSSTLLIETDGKATTIAARNGGFDRTDYNFLKNFELFVRDLSTRQSVLW